MNVSASDDPDAHQHGYGAIQWAGTGNGSIDMTGHKLSIITDGQGSTVNKDRPHGIVVESETLNINNVKGLDILVKILTLATVSLLLVCLLQVLGIMVPAMLI